MSIIDKSKELLNLLKNGTGYKTTLGRCFFDDEIKKILEIATNECKSTIHRKKDGKVIRYESDIDIQTVQSCVELFASDAEYIPAGITSNIFKTEYFSGPSVKIPFSKKKDGTLEVENIFGDSSLLRRDTERFLQEVINPIVEEAIDSDEKLRNKHRVGRIVNRLLNRKITTKTVLENCEGFLEEADIKPEYRAELSRYLVYSMQSEKFKKKIIDDEKKGESMTILGDKRKGYEKMVHGMALNAYEILDEVTVDTVKTRTRDVAGIYSNLFAQVEAEATDPKEKTPKEIEEIIKEVNYSTIDSKKKKYIGENGYRTHEVGITGRKIKLLPKSKVEAAMENLTKDMKQLIDSKDNLSKEEYLKETSRLHYRFIKIHPFPDGNGRTGRAISNMLLAQIGEVATYRKENKDMYLRGTGMLHSGIRDEQGYLESLAGDTAYCRQEEDKNIYLLEEYIGMKCINKPLTYEDREITKELPMIREGGGR